MSSAFGRLDQEQNVVVLKRRAVRGAAVTFAAQGTRFILQFGSQIVLARLLLPRDFGLVAMIGPIISFVQIFNELGLTQATVQREEISHDELSALFWVNSAVSAVVTACLCAAAPAVALFYGDPRLTMITVCLASLLLLNGLSSQQIALMNRGMRFVPLAVIDIACLAVAVVVGVAAAWAGAGYWSLVLMQAANSLTIAVLAWAASSWRPSWPRRVKGIGSLLRFGGHLTGYNLVSYVAGNLDGIVIGRVSGAVPLGLFDRSIKLVVVPTWQISLPVARVAVTLLSRLRGAEERYARAYLQMLQSMMLVMVPGFAWVAVMAPTLTPSLLGEAWVGASPIVRWLSVAALLSPLSLSTYWLFVTQDRVKQQLRYSCARTGFTVLALFAGLPWGVVGVAVSYAIFGVLIHGSMVWGATRSGPVRLPGLLRACLPIAVCTGLAAIALVLARRSAPFQAMPTAAGLVVSLGVAYGGSLLLMTSLPGGRAILRGLWALRSTFGKARMEDIAPPC